MGGLDSLRDQFKQFLLSKLQSYAPGVSDIVFAGIAVLWIAVFALVLHVLLQVFLRGALVRLADRKSVV